MKALSLWQPWASAIALGAKRIETRSWSTKHRGPIAIHAAASRQGLRIAMPVGKEGIARFWAGVLCVDFRTPRLARYDYAPNIETRAGLAFGAIVAVATLVDVMPTDDVTRRVPGFCEREKVLGDYSSGRFAWLLEDVQPVLPAVPTRGFQSLWELHPAIEQAVLAARGGTPRCSECDGSGTIEKCDWPGEHADRYQEPCPACARPNRQAPAGQGSQA